MKLLKINALCNKFIHPEVFGQSYITKKIIELTAAIRGVFRTQ